MLFHLGQEIPPLLAGSNSSPERRAPSGAIPLAGRNLNFGAELHHREQRGAGLPVTLGAKHLTSHVIKIDYKFHAIVISFDYDRPIETTTGGAVKQSEFVRWLTDQWSDDRASETTPEAETERQDVLPPSAPTKELATGTVEAVKKQLEIN